MINQFKLCAFADEADAMIDGQIKVLNENGIKYLEMRGIDGKNVSQISLEEAKAVKKKLDSGGIKVWAIGSPTGKIDISADFDNHFEDFKRMIEIAGIVGASHYRMFSFYGVTDSAKKEKALSYLQKLIDFAKGYGIVLCHENEKDIYGEGAAACLEIHKALPDLRAIFDPANFVQVGQDTLEAWELLEPYVEYMHIKDARTDGSVVPAGKGDGNVAALIAKFAAKGGRVLTLEPHLSVFPGLDELERGRKHDNGEFVYASGRAAFDASVSALREIG